jgi:hypothetical protein
VVEVEEVIILELLVLAVLVAVELVALVLLVLGLLEPQIQAVVEVEEMAVRLMAVQAVLAVPA